MQEKKDAIGFPQPVKICPFAAGGSTVPLTCRSSCNRVRKREKKCNQRKGLGDSTKKNRGDREFCLRSLGQSLVKETENWNNM